MAMTMKIEGLNEVGQLLGRLGDKAQDVASGALFAGAGVVADAFSQAAGSIRTAEFKGKRAKRLPSPEEKAALTGKSGIAHFDKNGSEVNTVVGISRSAGYVQLGKRKTAVMEIARSINSGTSFMDKQPIFRKASSGSQKAASAAIVNKANEMFNEIIGGQ